MPKRTKVDKPSTLSARLYGLDQKTVQEIAGRLHLDTGRPTSATDVIVYLCAFYRSARASARRAEKLEEQCNGD